MTKTTHVANATNKDIYARVGVNRINLTSIKAKGNFQVASIGVGKDCLSDNSVNCTNDKQPQRDNAVPFPAQGKVKMTCRFFEGSSSGDSFTDHF